MEDGPTYRWTDREGDELRVYGGASTAVVMIVAAADDTLAVAVHYGQPLDDLIDALTTIRDNNRA